MQGSGRDLWVILTYCLLILISGGLVLIGLLSGGGADGTGPNTQILSVGVICLVVVTALVPLALNQLRAQRSGANSTRDLLDAQIELLRQIHEHTMLSDNAKRIAYRANEREMLRAAIEEDISNEDWNAASVLVNDMAGQFGYRDEAEEFRRHIEQARADTVARRINEAMADYEDLIASCDWAAAYAAAARLQRLFPDNQLVTGLDRRVRDAWEERKHSLERQFLDAASRGDVDAAMELLREMDKYLAPREAEPYQEVARGVISKARENLGLQFKLAVRDHDWSTAVRVGETIVDEFPNTRMAHEVRERIDVLRARSGGAAATSLASSSASATMPTPPADAPDVKVREITAEAQLAGGDAAITDPDPSCDR